MNQISAQVIADSLNPYEKRITTMVVTFPRIILAEFNTHRMFSRNSASSRAIPFEKMVKSVEENPFVPIAWQKDHKGMQGTEYFSEGESDTYKMAWLVSRDKAVEQAEFYSKCGLTKQLCNRLLEPFMWHTVIVTATDWENFFALRCPQYEVTYTNDHGNIEAKYFRSWKDLVKFHFDFFKANRDVIEELEDTPILDRLKVNKGQAEIHMMALAEAMWDALNKSTPEKLKLGEWHIPFKEKFTYESNGAWDNFCDTVRPESKKTDLWEDVEDLAIKVSTAMCARVSYTVVGEEGKEPNYENDIKLHDRLAASGHWSPFEHCAKAVESPEPSGNFTYGWEQYRKTFRNENIKLP